MTNEQIIFNERLQLMESGVIGNTRRTVMLELEDGKRFLSWRKYAHIKVGKHAASRFKKVKKPLTHSGYGNTHNRQAKGKRRRRAGGNVYDESVFFRESQTEPIGE